MYRLFILLFFIISACSIAPTEEEIRQEEYGDLYTTMDCWWGSQQGMVATIWWCADTLDTELISGHVSLAIVRDLDGVKFFSICGRNVRLNSGVPLHDNLIATMTQHTYDCYESYERKLGNEFDWIWDEPTSTLQLIWRPADDLDKVLTVFVPKPVDSPRVLGSVYYKTGYFN